MLRLRNLICVLLFSISSYSQLDSLDDKYREDQIYFGVYYNSLADSPNDFSQNKFSSSVNLGFIRDFPLNKERNFGLGFGLGLSTSSYHNNLKFSNSNGQFDVAIISDSETFTKNKWALNEDQNMIFKKYTFKNGIPHRVIADHLKSSSFLIADGVMPSNEGRGYVLRRIMRRGMRHAHSLGNKEPVFHKLFPILLDGIKNSYPELGRAKDLITVSGCPSESVLFGTPR